MGLNFTLPLLRSRKSSGFLQDTIPCGSKVIILTAGDHNLGTLLGGNSPSTNPGVVKAFQSVGGAQFPNIQNNLPYILIGRKCGNAVEKIARLVKDTIILNDSMAVKRPSGTIFLKLSVLLLTGNRCTGIIFRLSRI